MLDPNDRHVYLEAIKPPDGYALGEAIATTYSLDLETLLSVPVALVLPQLDPAKLSYESAPQVLQAIRQASSRLTIFCDATSVAPPAAGVLYSQLEDVIVHVQAPHGGAFHPKLWLMRFDPLPDEDRLPWMRLVVLSRNLTDDRSWDVSLTLDGDLGGRRKVNQPIVQLLARLPSCSLLPLNEATQARLDRLSEQLGRTEWELPEGFEELQFHALGIGSKPKHWLPEKSDRLAVISPFVTSEALRALQASTAEPVALVARGEELDRCDGDVLRGFDAVHVMAATSAIDETEEAQRPTSQLTGLHAKAYVAKRGWNTHLYIGSANASSSALINGLNVEVMVELSGRTSVSPGKGIDGLLDKKGFGALLNHYEPLAAPLLPGAAIEQAELALRLAAMTLAQSKISLHFEPSAEGHVGELRAVSPLLLSGVAEAWAWLVSSDISSARRVDGLRSGGCVSLAACEPAGATSLVAFELRAEAADVRKQLVIRLPTTGVPADRDANVVRLVIKNREKLLQYILGLLQTNDPFIRAGIESQPLSGRWNLADSGVLGAGLLGHVVRAKARNPERLEDVGRILRELMATPSGRELVPTDLIQLWQSVTGEVVA